MTHQHAYLPQNMDHHGNTEDAAGLLYIQGTPVPRLVDRGQLVDAAQMEAAALALLETAHQNRYRWEDTSAPAYDRAPRDVHGYVHAYSPTTSQPLARLANTDGPIWHMALTSTGAVYARDGGTWLQVDPYTGDTLRDEEENPITMLEDLEDLEPEDFPIYRLR